MWNAVSDKDANDSDFSKYLFHYDYAAQQTGFVQPYADSPMDNEQVGEEDYITILKTAVLWQIVRQLWKYKMI